MTTLLCGITVNGNAVATNKAKTERFVFTKYGEFKTGDSVQFPEEILTDRVIETPTFNTPEAMLKAYLAQKKDDERAAKEHAEMLAAIGFSRSFVVAEKKLATAKDAYKSLADTYHGLLASPAELKKALKKAEAKVAKAKVEDAFKKICEKAFAKIPKSPSAPIKGAGYARESFPTIGNNRKLQILFSAIPANHKGEESSRRQKGYFNWSPVVSPEAGKAIAKILKSI